MVFIDFYRERKGEGEREKNICEREILSIGCLLGIEPTTLACALTEKQTSDLLVHGTDTQPGPLFYFVHLILHISEIILYLSFSDGFVSLSIIIWSIRAVFSFVNPYP